jgi:UPF0716 protein FxsA
MTLLLAFTLIPAIEIYLLIQIGHVIGAFETFMLIVFTGIVGAHLARTQGFALLHKIQEEAQTGFPSSTTVAEGVLILVGGILLITPGVITDAIGLLFIFPLSRKLLAPRVLNSLKKRAQFRYAGGVQMGGFPGGPDMGPFGQSSAMDEEADDDEDQGSHFKHPIQ